MRYNRNKLLGAKNPQFGGTQAESSKTLRFGSKYVLEKEFFTITLYLRPRVLD